MHHHRYGHSAQRSTVQDNLQRLEHTRTRTPPAWTISITPCCSVPRRGWCSSRHAADDSNRDQLQRRSRRRRRARPVALFFRFQHWQRVKTCSDAQMVIHLIAVAVSQKLSHSQDDARSRGHSRRQIHQIHADGRKDTDAISQSSEGRPKSSRRLTGARSGRVCFAASAPAFIFSVQIARKLLDLFAISDGLVAGTRDETSLHAPDIT